jgi:hypothetical protein
MIEDKNSTELKHGNKPEARYAYYRRCQEFRRNGEQCKAPAEKGSQICHAHAGQRAMALRRERERRAVLAEAVALMRKKGHLQCEMADLFTSFDGIQVTLAVMAQALIDGRVDCKTAGRLVVNLQTMSKLLRVYHRGHRETQRISTAEKTLPLIHTDNTDRSDKTDRTDRNDWRGMEDAKVVKEDAKVVKIVAIRGALRVNAIPYTDTGPSRWRKAA